MDITVKCGELCDRLSKIVGIASRKTAMPVLDNVLVDAADGSASLSATDTEISARVSVPLRVDVSGRALLPAKRLYEIGKLLPQDQDLRIATTDGLTAVMLACGRYSSRLSAMKVDDYPTMPDGLGPNATPLVGVILASLIRKVRFATLAEGDQRYYLAGAYMVLGKSGEKPTAMLVASDGHRLAIASAARPDGPETTALIPSGAFSELAGLFDDASSAVVDFTSDGNHLRFSSSDRLLVATRVEGTFPNYERIIPKPSPNAIVVDRDELVGAIRRIALAADGQTRSIVFESSNGKTSLSASSVGVGDATETLDAEYVGSPTSVRLSSAYLLDFLDAAEPGKVTLELRDGISPVLCKQIDENAYSYRCVVMPMVQ